MIRLNSRLDWIDKNKYEEIRKQKKMENMKKENETEWEDN